MNEESPMENLTLSMKVAKPHTIDPLEGHTVVIFEQVGDAGEEFRFEIEPGQTLPKTKRTLFEMLRGRKPPNYFAYAVTGMPELRWTFTTDVVLDIQAHQFTLLVTLAYSVSEPRLLVTRRNDDPIRQVRDHIAGLLTRHFAQRTWSEIRHDFRIVEREAIVATVELVRQFASFFGLRVHELALSHRLRDKDFGDILELEAVQRAKERAELVGGVARVQLAQTAQTETLKTNFEHERARQDRENEQELAIMDRDHVIDRRSRDRLVGTYQHDDAVRKAITDATVIAVGNVGHGIQNPDDLLRALNTFGGAAGRTAIGEGSSPPRGLLGEGGDGQSGVAIVIAEALVETERMGFDRAQKQRLQSAILHIVAEMLLDGDGDGIVIATHAARIDDFRHEPKLTMQHADYLKQFVKYETLRETLR